MQNAQYSVAIGIQQLKSIRLGMFYIAQRQNKFVAFGTHVLS